MERYIPPNPKIWQGRIIQCVDLQHEIPSNGVALLGFSSDEGVRRNQGRSGAKEGPLALRQALVNMPIKNSLKQVAN